MKRHLFPVQLALPLDYSASARGGLPQNPEPSKRPRSRLLQARLEANLAMLGRLATVPARDARNLGVTIARTVAPRRNGFPELGSGNPRVKLPDIAGDSDLLPARPNLGSGQFAAPGGLAIGPRPRSYPLDDGPVPRPDPIEFCDPAAI